MANVTYEYKAKGAAEDSYSTDVPTLAGEYTIRATVAETADYSDATATADFVIGEAIVASLGETKKEVVVVSDAWYSIDGRKLAGQPQAKGLYVNNGRVVLIK